MITRRQLREIHGNDLPLHVLEQDYVQSLFLQELYKRDDHLVFKGGTFIKHAFGLDRFSEDLDFTLHKQCDIEKNLTGAVFKLGSYGIASYMDGTKDDNISFNARLRYSGPLYDGSDRSQGIIRIEISKRQDVFLEPEWTRLFFMYPETAVVNVLGLRKNEVLAEKIRALSTRSKGRDLYDVWFLMNKGVDPDNDLFERKMRVMDQDAKVRIDITEKEWNEDLRALLPKPPEYKAVRDYVVRTLVQRGFKVE